VFMRKSDTRLDLMGKQSSASRPVIAAGCRRRVPHNPELWGTQRCICIALETPTSLRERGVFQQAPGVQSHPAIVASAAPA
jgi:hypothetical protein